MTTPDRPDAVDSQQTLPVPAEDHPLWKRAEENLADRARIDKDLARELLEAAVRAAEGEVLLSLAEEDPVPSSLSDTRAYRLYRISTLLGRTPEPYEVAAIFRVPDTTARTIITRMEATYPSLRERGLDAALKDTSGPEAVASRGRRSVRSGVRLCPRPSGSPLEAPTPRSIGRSTGLELSKRLVP